jgi:hypothetical protein
MKRIEYNGQSLVTGNEVADAVTHYVTRAAGMNAAVAVEVPVLAENGTVEPHTLILSAATQLNVFDVDGDLGGRETERFPVPEFPAVGGQGATWKAEAVERNAPRIDEDPLNPVL